jgi:toxin ParE1/3/4
VKVRFSAVAREDLVEIGDHIAEDNRSAARRYVAGLKARCAALKHFPHRHPEATDVFKGLRRAVFRSHEIYYSMDLDAGLVLIERIVHSMRDASQMPWSDH